MNPSSAALSEAELSVLRRVLAEAAASAASGRGGPFAAAVVIDGRVVALARNEVVATGDPTAHAEMTVLRAAARARGTHHLAGAVLVASCEPCPMCLGAAWWARVARIVHAATRHDAGAAGFDDVVLYREMAAPPAQRRLLLQQALPEEGRGPFAAWAECPTRRPY